MMATSRYTDDPNYEHEHSYGVLLEEDDLELLEDGEQIRVPVTLNAEVVLEVQ